MAAFSLLPLTAFAVTCLLLQAPCQGPTYETATPALTDSFSTESGGYLLAIPGVFDDFILFSDGQVVTRNDGTLRLSCFAQRALSIDREFYLTLEFAGRVQPGDAAYPPAGVPITTLEPSAYAPIGPVDPGTFVYYTQVTGTLVGLRSYAGTYATVANVLPAQIGAGASNKNVLRGLSVDLTLTVVSQDPLGYFAPTGPASLRADLHTDFAVCATHVDGNPTYNQGPPRIAGSWPGVADDYLFLPVGGLVEHADGTADLHGTLRRQNDYSDAWDIDLTLAGRVDPGDLTFPPVGSPVQTLLPAAYASQGGPADPDAWHYYTQVTGTLSGLELNAGGAATLATVGAVQLGVGANNGNLFYGLAARLAVTIGTQPPLHLLQPTGDLQVRAVLATTCLLPVPVLTTGITQSVDSVGHQILTYTGTDLGWLEQGAIGPTIVTTGQPHEWFQGYVNVVDHTTIELAIPQGLAPGNYPLRFLDVQSGTNQAYLDILAPTQLTLASETERSADQFQHWVAHQGQLTTPAISILLLSFSNTPSSLPGLVDLQIGAGFTDLFVYGAAVHDLLTGVALFPLPQVPANLTGLTLYAQTGSFDASTGNVFPLTASTVAATTYN